jgi:hypothetical protein
VVVHPKIFSLSLTDVGFALLALSCSDPATGSRSLAESLARAAFDSQFVFGVLTGIAATLATGALATAFISAYKHICRTKADASEMEYDPSSPQLCCLLPDEKWVV